MEKYLFPNEFQKLQGPIIKRSSIPKVYWNQSFVDNAPSHMLDDCNCPQGSIQVGSSINSVTYINSTSIPVNANGIDICIHGKLIIDRFNIFTNCTFYMDAASSIQITNFVISTGDSYYTTCSDIMYEGIIVSNGGFLIFKTNTIEHANYGINVLNGGVAYSIEDNEFIRNNIGIGIQQGAIAGNDIFSNTFNGEGGLLNGYTGQSPARDYLPYSGIEVNNNTASIGSLGANTFSTLKNGIVCTSSNIVANNNSFSTMVSEQGLLGQTIYGNGIWSINSNLSQAEDNTMDDCYIGINSFQSTLTDIESNEMSNVNIGIQDIKGRIATRIFNNTISYFEYGIRVLNAERNTNPSIYYNELSDLGALSNNRSSIGIQVNNAFGTGPGFHPEINYNEITLNFHNIGIETNNVFQVGFWNNIITGDNFKSGIHLVTSRYCHLFINEITAGTQNDDAIGIHVEYSQDTRYCCNTVEECSVGFKFFSASPRSSWRNNIITRCRVGLLIDPGSYFGRQMLTVPAGNSWTTWTNGSIQGINARNNSSYFYRQLSQIRALECALPQWPVRISPAQQCDNNSNNWFITTSNNNVTCFSDSTCEVSFAFVPTIDDWAIDVSKGDFFSEDYGEMHQWEASRMWYYDLKADEDLLNLDDDVDSFFLANASTNIQDLYVIDSLIEKDISLSSSDLDNLTEQKTGLDSILNLFILYSDSLKNASNPTDSANYHNIIIDLITESNDWLTEHNEDWDNWIEERDINASDIDSINGLINTDSDLADYLKAVNHVYLNSLAKGITSLDSTQFAQMDEIATICPLEGGKAVYLARILTNLNEIQHYNDSLSCSEVSPIISSNGSGEKSSIIRIIPNPADQYILMDRLDKSVTSDWLIVLIDITGKPIMRENWFKDEKSSKVLNTSTIQSGIYHVKCTSQTGDQLFTQKINIIH